ncbi:unnamed protein product [Brassica oleracea]
MALVTNTTQDVLHCVLAIEDVFSAHRCLNKDIEIGQRMITISTVGVPNTIKKLASHKLQSTLSCQVLPHFLIFY